jgi:phosphonate transport system permease protein
VSLDSGAALSLAGGFFPPDLKPGYLAATLEPLLQTVGMAVGGMLIALLIGLPMALLIGARAPGGRALHVLLTALRAIPDLTLAILCVVIFGLGPAAGMLALAIFYTAMVGKVFADLFLTADRAPIEALQATGAGRISVALFGFVPLTLKDLMSFGCYSFECAVRAAVIVGAVGGGGLGTELVGTLNGFKFHRAATIILILVLLVLALDALSWLLRQKPKAVLWVLPFGLYALWAYRPQFFTLQHAVSTIGGMFPPKLPDQAWQDVPRLIWETILIAAGGTAIAAVIGLIAGMLAARNIAPLALVGAARLVLAVLRAVPEVVWGLIIVAIVGVGPMAGVVALAIHNIGVLGKLYAESFENVDPAPVRAIEATGAPKLSAVLFAIIPLGLGPAAVNTLFRLEWNLRAATVVGMIGAGGIGQALYNAQQLFAYNQMMAYIVITWGIVLVSEWLSKVTRDRYGWSVYC